MAAVCGGKDDRSVWKEAWDLCVLNLSGDGRGGTMWTESSSALDLSHTAPFEFRRNYLQINIRVDVRE